MKNALRDLPVTKRVKLDWVGLYMGALAGIPPAVRPPGWSTGAATIQASDQIQLTLVDNSVVEITTERGTLAIPFVQGMKVLYGE